MEEHFLGKHERGRGAAFGGMIAMVAVLWGCAAETVDDVALESTPLYRGTVYSIRPNEAPRSIGLPDGSRVEYSLSGLWVQPVVQVACIRGFCSDLDVDNVNKWEHQGGWVNLSLHVRSFAGVRTSSQYVASLRCVYANGDPAPAPYQEFGDESPRGYAAVKAGEATDVEIACRDFGPGSTHDDGWVTEASVDVSLHDYAEGDGVTAGNDPLDEPWD